MRKFTCLLDIYIGTIYNLIKSWGDTLKEKRNLKVSFTKSGAGSTTNRITLPTTWIREMGITEDEKEVEVELDKVTKVISIKKK